MCEIHESLVVENQSGLIFLSLRIYSASAHGFERLLQTGFATDYADLARDYVDLARLGHVTRARITQIMNLLMLAPNIREQIPFCRVLNVVTIRCTCGSCRLLR